MTEPEIRTAILSTLHEVFNTTGDPRLADLVAQPDFAFVDLAGDSIEVTEFCFLLEEKTDLEIEISDLLDHGTLSAFSAFLAGRRPA